MVFLNILQALQEDLEQEQVKVNSLTHMVVVVDEATGDNATAALEHQLQVTMELKKMLFKIIFHIMILYLALDRNTLVDHL